MRILVVGSGISGVAAAAVLQRFGHEVVVLERADKIGGVWARAYPGVRLQNLWHQYCLSDFPWPTQPDENPTAAQILAYLDAAVEHFDIDIRCSHELRTLTHEEGGGWTAEIQDHRSGDHRSERFDFTVLAIGQYTQIRKKLELPGSEEFGGERLTDWDIDDLSRLGGKRLAVVGFGKTAVDLATFAAERGAQVEHVFRTPRWLIPEYVGGLMHYTFALFSRFGTVMIPCWTQPNAGERFLHHRLAGFVRAFWAGLGAIIRTQYNSAAWGKGPEARARIAATQPSHTLLSDMRSASGLAPAGYHPALARGEIRPHRGELSRFEPGALVLTNGERIECEAVLTCFGSSSPVFPFMSSEHRAILEAEPDGVQLYRHLLHPDIPDLAFAGYNHGFMHVPATEASMIWLAAMLAGELELPTRDQMLVTIDHVRAWKREHINFEPTRACAVNTRFHQYLDIILSELELEPKRKSNPLSEWFARYRAGDYAGMVENYQRKAAGRSQVLRPDPRVHT